jgi:hypothetical protein
MPTYLPPLALAASKVGCHIESSMRCLKMSLTIKCLPHLIAFAAADRAPYQVPTACFNTDSFSISIDTVASVMMGNRPDQFEDPTLKKEGPKMEGIQGGLVTEGTGTFNFHIENN